ncbi:alpha-(1-_6)-mannopyranosyltransferase A [Winogradskya consettensis]|uniref:Alpha-(1->6)-mannopyranosyltransferase A n=1 Tax=Winogradskya consettensis TaxID=113560 RepID=A0A919SKQ8_9ACTN|nr:polyprenol phosphomannose-dependent alpha 1,6 mannosyltransferase MptB [Actinoplanes consettensis]GIM73891.1 alpha-(1->6)-mannopyranosyltransferase A [Actinoplanes consettensis]
MRSDHALATATGGAGSLLVAAGGTLGRGGLTCAYAGLTLMLLGWWWYGRAGTAAPRHGWATLGIWAGPLLVAPPLFSRDVYSYLAQGLLAGSGHDVYRDGPAVLGGQVAALVPEIWQHTPAPYGPVALLASRTVTAVTGEHVGAGVFGMRLVAVAGLALLAVTLPRLTRDGRAWWLVILNPLVLIHLVGGAHNDALMVGLLAAGLAAALHRHPVAGAVLVTMAALVKAPAALGLVAVAIIGADSLRATHQGRGAGRWAGVNAWAVTAAVAGVTTVVVTAVAGSGYGWVGALGTPVSAGNWSLTGVLGRVTAQGVGSPFAIEVWRWAGVLATVVSAGLVWAYRERIGALPGLGLALLAVVIFGPALRPWYVIWALVPLAVVPAAHRGLALLSAVLTPVVLPDGYAADRGEVLLAVLGALLGVAAFALATTATPASRALR